MKNSKNNFCSAGQSTTEVKKSHKHDANLQKNSTLYFQIGLILCLLGTYALFEMQFQDQNIVIDYDTATNETITLDYVKPFIAEVIKPKELEPLPSTDLKDIFKVVLNDTQIIEKIINTPDAPKAQSEPVAIGDIPDFKEPTEDIIVPFRHIEKVPVYPGCEKYDTNEKRRKCMSDKISKLVSRKFNGDIAEENGLSGIQTIQIQFTIDKFGNVIDIRTRAPHPALEKEAKRVINKIPNMQPGLQRNTPVGVIYTLPIRFMVRD